MEAFKIIMASSSPVFGRLLQKSKDPHTLIFLRGFQSKDLASILDFLYFAEANVYQRDLNSFLAVAEEIKLKDVAGQTYSGVLEQQEKPEHFEPASIIKEGFSSTTTTADERHLAPDGNAFINPSEASTIPNEFRTKLQALGEKVNSMMKKGQKELMVCPTVKHHASAKCVARKQFEFAQI